MRFCFMWLKNGRCSIRLTSFSRRICSIKSNADWFFSVKIAAVVMIAITLPASWRIKQRRQRTKPLFRRTLPLAAEQSADRGRKLQVVFAEVIQGRPAARLVPKQEHYV